MRKPKSTSKKFNVMLDPEVYADLEKLADARKVSMGAVIRALIVRCAQHEFHDTPCCASGQACFVPQMHQMQKRG